LKWECWETLIFLEDDCSGLSLYKYYDEESPPGPFVKISPLRKKVAIQNLHFKCLKVRKQIAAGPMGDHVFSAKATWLDVNNLLQLQINFERSNDESKFDYWSEVGRACCNSSFLATFFVIPTNPVPRDKADALAATVDWMARTEHVEPFGQELFFPGTGRGFGLGDGDCSQPWPTQENKLDFIKMAYADVLKSPESLWAPIQWIDRECSDDDRAVRIPTFTHFFNAFIGLLSFDFTLSLAQIADLFDKCDTALTNLNEEGNPFYHTFIQFAAKVSAKFG
jgi:hypothetical protein